MKRQVALLGAVVVIVVAVLGLWLALRGGSDDAGASIDDTVRFDFDADLVSSTSGDFTAEQVTVNSGEVTSGPSYDGAGQAAVYPAFAGDADGPRAVLAVLDAVAAETLSPGEARFQFGADALLDDPSQGGEFDNGNNVVQRGFFGVGGQFKLQIDKDEASCRVEGDAGDVTAKSSVEIEAGEWYRLACERRDDMVMITVTPIDDDGTLGKPVTDEESGSIGAVDLADDTPLSIGGKLDKDLAIEEESDQFNGSLDNVFVAIS